MTSFVHDVDTLLILQQGSMGNRSGQIGFDQYPQRAEASLI